MNGRKWLGAAIVTAVVAGGSGAVFAASAPWQGHGRVGPFSSAFWTALAAKVNVPAATLETDAKSILASERANWKPAMPPSGAGPRMPAMGMRAAGTVFLSAAAKYLGISSTTLLSDLRSGQSLAQITQNLAAKNPNLSVSGLESALVSAVEAQLPTEIDQLVTHSFPAGRWGHAGSSGTQAGTAHPRTRA